MANCVLMKLFPLSIFQQQKYESEDAEKSETQASEGTVTQASHLSQDTHLDTQMSIPMTLDDAPSLDSSLTITDSSLMEESMQVGYGGH